MDYDFKVIFFKQFDDLKFNSDFLDKNTKREG